MTDSNWVSYGGLFQMLHKNMSLSMYEVSKTREWLEVGAEIDDWRCAVKCYSNVWEEISMVMSEAELDALKGTLTAPAPPRLLEIENIVFCFFYAFFFLSDILVWGQILCSVYALCSDYTFRKQQHLQYALWVSFTTEKQKNKRHCSNQNNIAWMQPDLVYSHHVIP